MCFLSSHVACNQLWAPMQSETACNKVGDCSPPEVKLLGPVLMGFEHGLISHERGRLLAFTPESVAPL